MSRLAYISVSYNKRHLLNEELLVITEVLHQFGINSLVFADNYQFDKSQEKEMMQRSSPVMMYSSKSGMIVQPKMFMLDSLLKEKEKQKKQQ